MSCDLYRSLKFCALLDALNILLSRIHKQLNVCSSISTELFKTTDVYNWAG